MFMCTARSARPAAMVAAQAAFTLVMHDSHRAGSDAVFTLDHCVIGTLHSVSALHKGIVQQLDARIVITACYI
jgi:hypothetical protein